VESFEQFCAVALEHEGLVVSEAVKFPVTRQTKKTTPEIQTHGYEVDLVGARADQLVLATVKSYFGSHGVHSDHVKGVGGSVTQRSRYKLLNDPFIRTEVVKQAAKRYGYRVRDVRLRLYVGRFAGRAAGAHEAEIRRWAKSQRVGGGPIEVFSLDDVVDSVRQVASSTTYRNNPVLVTMKVLNEAGLLSDTSTDGVTDA
jgi:hypothetical protein